MNGPLSGIRIVEVGHMLAGPYCGLMLANMGAEVIKIESPEGDIGRTVSPHFVGPHNVYFASLNHSKKSVVLDLGTAEGQSLLGEIVSESHALITNLRPSAIKKLGLDYASLQKWNQNLVCVALTGFGLEGPYSQNPAYDYVIQALTGVMKITGEPGGLPTKTGYSVVDNTAGLAAALGLVAKLVSGKGGQVDVAMYDVMLSQLNYLTSGALNAGEVIEPMSGSAHPYLVPAQVFSTADGWLTLFISHDKFWKIFCEELGCNDWVSDPVFATTRSRRDNREQVVSAVAEILKTRSAAHWVKRLQPLGIVVAEVGTLNEALESDITESRKMVVPLGDGSVPLRATASPIRFDDYTPNYALPPLLNQHADSVLGAKKKR